MTKMRPQNWPLMLASALITAVASLSSTLASDCPHKDALGTARVLTVDPKAYPRVGTKSFPQTLPLGDHEVVLTFDDGPHPPTTAKILAALAQECVRATFFLIGQTAAEHPDMVKRIAREGHTVGHHSWSHPVMSKIPHDKAVDNIDRGIAADEMALNGVTTTVPSTPFFRFPYFDSTPATLDLLQSRGIAVFGADLWASDWDEMTPEQTLKLVTERLDAAGKGIILFHDPKARTAAMMPAFLRYLREHGYHVVHIVPPAHGQRNADVTR